MAVVMTFLRFEESLSKTSKLRIGNARAKTTFDTTRPGWDAARLRTSSNCGVEGQRLITNSTISPLFNLIRRRESTMSNTKDELNGLFAVLPETELQPDVLGELQSILRLHSIDPQELSYKWEAHAMRMGVESAKMDLEALRNFKKDLQESLERDARGKSYLKSVDKRATFATPRNSKGPRTIM